ncbi:hypothetical protein IW261DRAFT_1414878 [Armillaria novae-zelandiae]|uniref:Uncharacterized protein n=1 Tax=Armillaria novae-zelandiae TaxID=153914 RepID=A0AA39PML9_9AGAR|nr:hypothetical protein IW261DRAFT_1414878 [Armillaria novae-zelandiae]
MPSFLRREESSGSDEIVLVVLVIFVMAVVGLCVIMGFFYLYRHARARSQCQHAVDPPITFMQMSVMEKSPENDLYVYNAGSVPVGLPGQGQCSLLSVPTFLDAEKGIQTETSNVEGQYY